MSDPGSATHAAALARQHLLIGVAKALEMLAAQVLPHGDAARDVAVLAAQAEALASEAWALSTTRTSDGKRAVALAAEFRSFISDAAELSQRAGRSAAASREVASLMRQHATVLTALGRNFDGQDDIAALRARLRPLVAALGELPARLRSGTDLAEDVIALGTRAVSLASAAEALERDSRNPAAAAIAIYNGLRSFADAASTVASGMLEDANKVRSSVAGLAARATQIAVPAEAAAAQLQASASGRLGDVVRAGMEMQRGNPRSPSTDAGERIVWGKRA